MSTPYESISKDSKWIKIPEGGKYEGVYLGWEEGDKYRGSRVINYKFDGHKILSSSSKRLAQRMSNVEEGSKVCIKKFGSGMDTNYEVEIMGKAEKVEW